MPTKRLATTKNAPVLVTGVPRSTAPYGLFSVVTPRDQSDPHWQFWGAEWATPPCRELGLIGDPSCDPSDSTGTTGLPKNFDDAGPGVSDATPFSLYAPYLCAPVGGVGEGQELATTMLQTQEQEAVERALWEGTVDNRPNLRDSAQAAAPDALDPLSALAELENEFQAGHGLAGIIHASPWAATILAKTANLTRTGSSLTTALGTPVVAGAGYAGEHKERVYITPPMFIYRSEIFTSSNRAGDLLDRATNDLYAIAERTYLVGWDDCPPALYVDIDYPA